MLTEELLKYLEEQNGKKVILKLNGIISTKLEIEKINIKHEDGYLFFQNEKDTSASIKLNLHQLKKVNKANANLILLEFDQLQNVLIEIV